MEKWQQREFGELYKIPSRNGLSKPSKVRGIGYKMINMGELFSNDRIYNIDMELVSLTDAEKEKAKIEKNDLLFARQSLVASGAGKCSIVMETDDLTVFESHLIRVRLDRKIANPMFYYYYFKSSNSPMKAIIQHSVQAGIKASDLEKLLVSVPPLEIQTKIAELLSKMDDMINVNNRINKNLEQQVSILYQSWFENFEITNGVCPESWFYQELSTIADIASGKRPPVKSDTCNEKTPIPIVGAASVMGFTSEANHSDKILVTGRVGTHGVIQRFNTPCWTSDNTLVITSPYYEFTNQILHKIDYSSMNRGSTQPLITQGDMKKVVVLVPDEDTLAKFEKFASSLMAKWNANNKENIKLASLRDTLLPKLMSGELDVFNIEL